MYYKNINRKKDIILFLLNNKEFISTEEIGKIIGISNKTVQKDLKSIEIILKDYKSKIVKKTGKGILIQISDEEAKKLRETLDKKVKDVEDYPSKERQRIIISQLFFDNIKTITELCNKLYVTRNSILKDLLEIESWLKRFDIFLHKKDKIGFELEGKEENIRAALVYYLFKIDKEIAEENIEKSDFFITKKRSQNIKFVLSEEEFFKLEVTVFNFLNKENIYLSEESLTSLIFSLAVSVYRIKNQKYIDINFNRKEENFSDIEDFFYELEKEFKISLIDSEKKYINKLIYFYCLNPLNKNDYEYEEPLKIKIKEVSEQIIQLLKNNSEEIYIEDKNEIINYITNLVESKKINATIYNYYTDEIKYTFPKIYGVIWMLQEKMSEIFGKLLSEDDIGYFTLFLNSLILKNRKTKKIKIALICNKEVGVFYSLTNRLEKYYSDVEFEYFKNLDKTLDFKDFDLIVSTKRLVKNFVNYVLISPILNDSDISILDEKINKIRKNRLNI